MKKLFPLPFFKNFIKCGIAGWCMEILFTAMGSLRRREMPLMGQTSLWMFPIYGSAAFFKPVFLLFRRFPVLMRGTFYAAAIFATEFVSGRFLTRHRLCPWNYERHKWHVDGLIRLDFFPFWFTAGLLYERILASAKALPCNKY